MTRNLGKLLNDAHELAEVYAMSGRKNEFRILSELIGEVENEDSNVAGGDVSDDPFSWLPADGCP